MPDSAGDAAQIRQIADAIGKQSAQAAIIEFANQYPEIHEARIPPTIKWFGIIAGGVLTAGVTGFCFWIVTTLNDMQLALQDVQTQLGQSGSIEARFGEVNRRIDRLEDIHKREAR